MQFVSDQKWSDGTTLPSLWCQWGQPSHNEVMVGVCLDKNRGCGKMPLKFSEWKFWDLEREMTNIENWVPLDCSL